MKWKVGVGALLVLWADHCTATVAELAATSRAPLRIACVGDSITLGVGLACPETQSFPARLGQLWLSRQLIVSNFGVSGRTLLRGGDYPYVRTTAFRAAMEFAPDAVIVLFGANDTRPPNRPKLGEFKRDAVDLVRRFQALPSRPMVFVALPTPVWDNSHGVDGTLLREFVIPRWCEVAAECRARLMDLHTPLLEARPRFPDGVHPDELGALAIAMLADSHVRSWRTKVWVSNFRLQASGSTRGHGDPTGAWSAIGELWYAARPNLKAVLAGEDWLQLHQQRVAAAAQIGAKLLLIGDDRFDIRDSAPPSWLGIPTAWMGYAGDQPPNVLWRLRDALQKLPTVQRVVVGIDVSRVPLKRDLWGLFYLDKLPRTDVEIAVLLGPYQSAEDYNTTERLAYENSFRRPIGGVTNRLVWLDQLSAMAEVALTTDSTPMDPPANDPMYLIHRWLQTTERHTRK